MVRVNRISFPHLVVLVSIALFIFGALFNENDGWNSANAATVSTLVAGSQMRPKTDTLPLVKIQLGVSAKQKRVGAATKRLIRETEKLIRDLQRATKKARQVNARLKRQ